MRTEIVQAPPVVAAAPNGDAADPISGRGAALDGDLAATNVIADAFWSSAIAAIKPETIFQAAIDACPFGVVLVEPLGKIVLANSEIERIFGYTRAELIGRPFSSLAAASFRAQPHCQFTAYAGHRGSKTRLSGLHKDGSEISIEAVLSPIQFDERDLAAVVRITDRPPSEPIEDDLVARVSHELRTPLASISGALGLLINGSGQTLPQPMMRLLTIVHSNSQRLVQLVNNVLDTEKIETRNAGFVKRGAARDTAPAFGEIGALVGRKVADVERDLILETLKRRFGNRTHAAATLGISIRTLRNKLNEYAASGVTIPPSGGSDIGVAHQRRFARKRNAGRGAQILELGAGRHAVL